MLVAGLPFFCLVFPEEVVRGEVAASCIKDSLDREGIMNGVVGINLLKAPSDDSLDAGVEPFEEGGVIFIDGNLMVCEERVGNS